MNRLLFADYLRRSRRHYFYLGFFAATPWILAAEGDAISIHTALAVALSLAGMGAPQTWQTFAPREIRLLPVSRRDLWRTAWWLGAVGFVGAVIIGQVIGAAIGALVFGSNRV